MTAPTPAAGDPAPGHPDADTLSWYADGELPAGEMAAVAAHLADCAACRAEVAANQRLTVAVRRLTAAPVPAGFSGDVAVLVAGVPQERARPFPGRRIVGWLRGASRGQWAVGLAGAVGAAVLIVAAWTALCSGQPGVRACLVGPRTGGDQTAQGGAAGTLATVVARAVAPAGPGGMPATVVAPGAGTVEPAAESAATVAANATGATPDEADRATAGPVRTAVAAGAGGTPGGAGLAATGGTRVAGAARPAKGAGVLTVVGGGEEAAGVARVWLPVVERGG